MGNQVISISKISKPIKRDSTSYLLYEVLFLIFHKYKTGNGVIEHMALNFRTASTNRNQRSTSSKKFQKNDFYTEIFN